MICCELSKRREEEGLASGCVLAFFYLPIYRLVQIVMIETKYHLVFFNGSTSITPTIPDSIFMKNIQIIDGATNCTYDIFSATDDEFDLIFRQDTDIAFIDEVFFYANSIQLDAAFNAIWSRRIAKKDAKGIHGILFYDRPEKKIFYPTRRDEEAINLEGFRRR
jgi:hypothetical protein